MDDEKHITFRQPSFVEYFNTFEDEILVDMAENHPETLRRMCSLISLDIQIEKERYTKFKQTEYRA